MGNMVSHWYHIYASGNWKFIYDQHYKALETSGLLDSISNSFFVGIVGTDYERKEAIEYLSTKPVQPTVAVESETGWEQETLDALLTYAKECSDETYILYCHTKGASYSTESRDPSEHWRAVMTYCNINKWETAIQALKDGSHMVGAYWRSGVYGQQHYFGGNFWWAKSSVIAVLDPCSQSDRWQAETWIGLSVFHFKEIVVTNLLSREISDYIPIESLNAIAPVTEVVGIR